MRNAIVIYPTDKKLNIFKVGKSAGKYSLERIVDQGSTSKEIESFISSNPDSKAIAIYPGHGVGFYNLTLPNVEDKKLSTIIDQQANSLLPLSTDNIVHGWRINEKVDNKLEISLAASAKSNISNFAKKYFNSNLNSVVIDAEALVSFANHSVDADNYILITIFEDHVEFVQVKKRHVEKTMMFTFEDNNFALVAHELETAAEHLGISLQNYPIYIVDHGDNSNDFCEYLENIGLKSEILKNENISESKDLNEIEIKAIGAAMLLFNDQPYLNLFQKFSKNQIASSKKHGLRSMSTAIAVLVIAIFIAVLAVPAIDISTNNRLDDIMATLPEDSNQADFMSVSSNYAMRKKIAKDRIDIVKLFITLKEVLPEGMLIDSFNYKKTKKISFAGLSPNYETLYKLQESLNNVKNIKNVRLISPKADPQKKQVKYTIEFDYKNYTGKSK